VFNSLAAESGAPNAKKGTSKEAEEGEEGAGEDPKGAANVSQAGPAEARKVAEVPGLLEQEAEEEGAPMDSDDMNADLLLDEKKE
jgi:hypothetical protein